MVTGVVPATISPMPKSVQGSSQIVKQCNGITTSISDCVYVPYAGTGRVVYIYIPVAPSHCDCYGGFNASFDNASWSMM